MVDEVYMCLMLGGVLVVGFVMDFIGMYVMFGVFVFGLMMFKGGDFVEKLIESIEDFVLGLLFFLYFVLSGLKMDVVKIKGGKVWGLLVLVMIIVCIGKIVGMFMVVMMCMILVSEFIMFGVLMNMKGFVELIVLNIGKEKKVSVISIFVINFFSKMIYFLFFEMFFLL